MNLGIKGWTKIVCSILVMLLSMIFIVACGSAELDTGTAKNVSAQTPTSEPQEHDKTSVQDTEQYLFSVEVTQKDMPATIAAQYNAEVIVWEPYDNFAILSSTDKQSLVGIDLDENKDSLELPINALGKTGWASGKTGWASGKGGWASGKGGWAVGPSGWAVGPSGWAVNTNSLNNNTNSTSGQYDWQLGVNNAYIVDNEDIWKQIGLFGAHKAKESYLADTYVMVAVIDTGIDLQHPMFANSLVPQDLWRDYVDNDNTPQDEISGTSGGHGTAVAGIILQIAPEASILPIRVLGPDGLGDMDHVVLAIHHAIKSGADIINISLGSDELSHTMKRILQYAKDEGVYVVAAGGNTGEEDNILYPARFSNEEELKNTVFSVGSVTANDDISNFSTVSNQLFAYAPGEDIRTAFPGNRFANVSGTSFAAPVVTGSIALVYDEMIDLGVLDSRIDPDGSNQSSSGALRYYVQHSLEKKRIEERYNLHDIYSEEWKYAGGIIDTNTLAHLTKTDTFLTNEEVVLNWDFATFDATVLDYATITKIVDRDSGYPLEVIDVIGGSYITRDLYDLDPNTTYEMQFKMAFETPGQEISIWVELGDEVIAEQTFKQNIDNTRMFDYITMTFKTGDESQNIDDNPFYLTMVNSDTNDSVYVNNFKFRIAP